MCREKHVLRAQHVRQLVSVAAHRLQQTLGLRVITAIETENTVESERTGMIDSMLASCDRSTPCLQHGLRLEGAHRCKMTSEHIPQHVSQLRSPPSKPCSSCNPRIQTNLRGAAEGNDVDVAVLQQAVNPRRRRF